MTPGKTGTPPETGPLPRGAPFTLEETYRPPACPWTRADAQPGLVSLAGLLRRQAEDLLRAGSAWLHRAARSRGYARGYGGWPADLADPRQGPETHAFYNVCRHRGSMLVGQDGGDIIRYYHSWGYALDGRLLGAPYFKGLDIPESSGPRTRLAGSGLLQEDFGLLPVRSTWGCFVFVNLDSEARPLGEWLGDLDRRLGHYPFGDLRFWRRNDQCRRIGSSSPRLHGYYHLPWVHPELNTVSSLDNHEGDSKGPGGTGMCTTPLARNPVLPSTSGVLPAMPGLTAKDAEPRWILIVPNIACSCCPTTCSRCSTGRRRGPRDPVRRRARHPTSWPRPKPSRSVRRSSPSGTR